MDRSQKFNPLTQPIKLAVMKSPKRKRVAGQTSRKNGAVVSLQRPTAAILQEDLEELILLRRRVRESREALNAKEDYLEAALRSGAKVENGVHTARLSAVVEVE